MTVIAQWTSAEEHGLILQVTLGHYVPLSMHMPISKLSVN
jgi:hypothetical protein